MNSRANNVKMLRSIIRVVGLTLLFSNGNDVFANSIPQSTTNPGTTEDPQCGGCQGGVTAPCLKITTYCEGYTAVSHIPEELADTLNKSLKCKWAEILDAARRTFDRAARTYETAYQAYTKAKEAWRHAQDIGGSLFWPRRAWESAKKAWAAAKEAWRLAKKAWQFAQETASAADEFCERTRDLIEDVNDRIGGWFSRCITNENSAMLLPECCAPYVLAIDMENGQFVCVDYLATTPSLTTPQLSTTTQPSTTDAITTTQTSTTQATTTTD